MSDEIIDNLMKNYMQVPPPKKVTISDSELELLNKKAYMDALQQVLKTSYQRQMVMNLTEGILPYTPKDSVMLKMLQQQSDSISTKPPFMLVTVNPRQGVSFAELNKAVLKFVSKKSVGQYFYVYEVRKEDEGLHCHMLVQYTTKPYDFKRSTKSTFKNVCASNNPNILNFKFVSDENLQSKIEYLLGDKKDSKKAGVKYTKQYRATNKISDFYESSPPLPCRATQTLTIIPKNAVIVNIEEPRTPSTP